MLQDDGAKNSAFAHAQTEAAPTAKAITCRAIYIDFSTGCSDTSILRTITHKHSNQLWVIHLSRRLWSCLSCVCMYAASNITIWWYYWQRADLFWLLAAASVRCLRAVEGSWASSFSPSLLRLPRWWYCWCWWGLSSFIEELLSIISSSSSSSSSPRFLGDQVILFSFLSRRRAFANHVDTYRS